MANPFKGDASGDAKGRQSSDAQQHGGGLNPGQDYMDLYTPGVASHSSTGAGSPTAHDHKRDREHTRG